MRLPVRFSLRFFLLFASVVILFCGYSQNRRREITTTVRALERKYGATIDLPEGTFDSCVWQRLPSKSFVWMYSEDADKELQRIGIEERRYYVAR
jgi:hypothetical protein